MLTRADLDLMVPGDRVLDEVGRVWTKSGTIWMHEMAGMNSVMLARRSPIDMPICTCPDDQPDGSFAWDCVFCATFHEWQNTWRPSPTMRFLPYLRSKVTSSDVC